MYLEEGNDGDKICESHSCKMGFKVMICSASKQSEGTSVSISISQTCDKKSQNSNAMPITQHALPIAMAKDLHISLHYKCL